MEWFYVAAGVAALLGWWQLALALVVIGWFGVSWRNTR